MDKETEIKIRKMAEIEIYSKKIVAELAEKQEKIEELEHLLRLCAGLISTMPEHSNKHPQDVEKWIYNEMNTDSAAES